MPFKIRDLYNYISADIFMQILYTHTQDSGTIHVQFDILLSSQDNYTKTLAKKDIDKQHWAATVQQPSQYGIIAKTP